MAASVTLEPLGEVGANFSLQLSSRIQFTKVNNKEVIAENRCEKHKKSSLIQYICYRSAIDLTPTKRAHRIWIMDSFG